MKRTAIAAIVLSLALAGPALAIESSAPPKAPTANFEQKKAQILKNIDDRLSRLQKERECFQAAKSDDDLRGCRVKSGPPRGSGLPPGAGPLGIAPPTGGTPPPGGAAAPPKSQ